MARSDLDLVLLLQACSEQLNADVLARVRAEVGADIRFHDGFLFQHLVEGPIGVSALGRRLGVSQQAASKQVADLCDRGLARVRPDPADRRSRLVELTDRGRATIDAGRRARADVARAVDRILGRPTAALVRSALAELGDETGAVERLLGRRLRPDHETGDVVSGGQEPVGRGSRRQPRR